MASSVQLNVAPDTMQKLATLVENKIDEWNNAVQAIYQLQSEMDSMWDGDANNAFNQIFEEDKTKFSRLMEGHERVCGSHPHSG